jgi:hypothetical protein
MSARVKRLDDERQAIEAQLAEAATDQEPIQPHPRAGEHYAAIVAELQAWLATASAGETRAQRERINAVRALIEKIEIIPRTQDRGGATDLVLDGRLAAFLEGAQEPSRNFRLGALVAGGGIEPPTCGL